MKTLNHTSFKLMPWKNGRGITTELIREDIGHEMAFRLSRATISENGTFSIFEGLKRILIILNGEGCELSINSRIHSLMCGDILTFDGSDKVEAKLIQNEVVDFNVFYNPVVYSCEVSWVENAKVKTEFRAYLYFVDEQKLIVLDSGDELFVDKKAIFVELKKAP